MPTFYPDRDPTATPTSTSTPTPTVTGIARLAIEASRDPGSAPFPDG